MRFTKFYLSSNFLYDSLNILGVKEGNSTPVPQSYKAKKSSDLNRVKKFLDGDELGGGGGDCLTFEQFGNPDPSVCYTVCYLCFLIC